MTLYHGSYLAIEKPDLSFSRNNVDFGRGYYTTPIKEQAIRWSNRFKRKYGQSVVSAYSLDEPVLRKNALILEFNTYSDEWLDFVVACRKGEQLGEFEVVIGGVANDKVFDTIQLFLDGLIDKKESIRRLRFEKPNIQYCFRSQTIIDTYLEFVSSEVVS
jgi:hypothetical protein